MCNSLLCSVDLDPFSGLNLLVYQLLQPAVTTCTIYIGLCEHLFSYQCSLFQICSDYLFKLLLIEDSCRKILSSSKNHSATKAFDVGGTTLSLALFTDVANSKELLDLMQEGTLQPEIALLNASLIPKVFPVLAAVHKTLIAKSRDALTTRTLHSELVFNYSGSKHISESLKRCGISDNTSYILVVRFAASADEVTAIKGLIKGVEIGLDELRGRANQAQIQKHYKIPAPELVISSVSDAITCRIAARDAL